MNQIQPPSTIDRIKNTASDLGENISDGLNAAKENVSQGLNRVSENINNTVDDFSSNSTVKATNDFLSVNTNIAKFAFLILVVVAFIVLFNLGIQLIGYFFSTSMNPYLIKGQVQLQNAGIYKKISQDPKVQGSITIPRSNNATTGIEFTWTAWILYSATNDTTSSKLMNVWHKGDQTSSTNRNNISVPSLNNAPGVYFGPPSNQPNSIPETNSLWILMDTVPTPAGSTVNMDQPFSTEYIEITNIPIGKYFHLAIRCENKFIDVYINGSVVSHTNLVYVPKQNYYDVFVGDDTLSGSYISNLRYFSTALSIIDINNIVTIGPNTENAIDSRSLLPQYVPNYLSSFWYQQKIM
jgi:hypothetical protein